VRRPIPRCALATQKRHDRSHQACSENEIIPGVEAGTLSALRSSRMLAVGTGARIVLSPVVMALVLNHSYTIATIVFLVAAATDWVDGRLARRWGVTSRLGSFLDTTADKLLVTTALIALVSVQRVSPWIALIIVAREFVILGLRLAVESGGRHMETSMLGKWKATVQFVAIALAMIRPDVVIAGAYLDQWAMVIAAVVTAWSGIDYLVRSSDALRSAPS
jgi:CDP-diacylglycerol---glycerol-3-phosphate 3-phosphatidyltransferase